MRADYQVGICDALPQGNCVVRWLPKASASRREWDATRVIRGSVYGAGSSAMSARTMNNGKI